MTLIDKNIARSAVQSIVSDTRASIVGRAWKMRAEIEQIFADVEHWNRVNVPWKGPPINPDPDGKLRRIADAIGKMLANETPNVLVSGDQRP